MSSIPKIVVTYDGTNLGPIYLKDIAQRNQLGGGRGIYFKGQDQYINKDATATLFATSDVMLSCSVLGPDTTGVIRSHMRVAATPLGQGCFTVSYLDSSGNKSTLV